ncbi:MAG: hypothetical protein RLO02_00930, partial [Roseitalea porphyridii]
MAVPVSPDHVMGGAQRIDQDRIGVTGWSFLVDDPAAAGPALDAGGKGDAQGITVDPVRRNGDVVLIVEPCRIDLIGPDGQRAIVVSSMSMRLM